MFEINNGRLEWESFLEELKISNPEIFTDKFLSFIRYLTEVKDICNDSIHKIDETVNLKDFVDNILSILQPENYSISEDIIFNYLSILNNNITMISFKKITEDEFMKNFKISDNEISDITSNLIKYNNELNYN